MTRLRPEGLPPHMRDWRKTSSERPVVIVVVAKEAA